MMRLSSSGPYSSSLSSTPKRSRSGPVIWPARVVAPTSVKRGRLMRMLWALGPFADHDIQRIVFQRRIQHLFHLPGQAVDLIDEQHIALLQVGQQGGKVAGLFNGRAAGDADLHPPSRWR